MTLSRTSPTCLLFAAVLVMFFAFHSISAIEEPRRGKDLNSSGGLETAEKRSQPLRERRAILKKNSTEDILQRVQDLEKK